jgi:hypothetical protein
MGSTPFSSLLGGISAIVSATLVRYRVLWFLHEDTILSGGRRVSTAEFAATLSKYFYMFGGFAIVLGFVLLFTLSEEHRRRIAQLPRWQRFLVWPIDSHIAPRNPDR